MKRDLGNTPYSAWRNCTPGTWLILFLSLLMLSAGCSRGPTLPSGGPVRRVSIGIQTSPAMTLVMVAKEKGFFKAEGADVDLKEFTAGKFALQAFLAGAIDFAVSGEVPVCLASLQGNQIRVVTQVVETTVNEVRVVALKEPGVTDPRNYFNLKKRRLATSFGGGPEFFTHTFLRHNQISTQQVEIVSQRPEDMPAALEARSVDAIAIFDPFAFIAEKRLGDKAITFADPSLYSEFYVLNARPEQVQNNPQVIEALLRALLRAANFISEKPNEAKQIMQRYTKLDSDVVDGIWANFSFRPALVQKLIDYWNAQAIWALETGKVSPGTRIPDFRRIVDDRFLKRLDPARVRL